MKHIHGFELSVSLNYKTRIEKRKEKGLGLVEYLLEDVFLDFVNGWNSGDFGSSF